MLFCNIMLVFFNKAGVMLSKVVSYVKIKQTNQQQQQQKPCYICPFRNGQKKKKKLSPAMFTCTGVSVASEALLARAVE